MSVATVEAPLLAPQRPPVAPRVHPALRPAPPLEPPYDDEPTDLRHATAAPAATGHGRADVLPFAPTPRWRQDTGSAPRRAPGSVLPPPQPWAGRLLQAAIEVQAGQRSLQQLMPWTSEQVYIQLTWWVRRSPSAPAQVRSVHVCEPAPGVAEVSAVVRRCGGRSQAVAARLEGLDGRWRCTALRFL